MAKPDLCNSCQKILECIKKGIISQEICKEYEPLSLEEELERNEFIDSIMVGPCPKCGNENTYDCGSTPPLKDETIGHCLNCETYWCIECGYVFKAKSKGIYLTEKLGECPHWQFCGGCSKKKGYLDLDEFMDKICSKCEYYKEGCQLEDPTECEKEEGVVCPYRANVSECSELRNFLSSADCEANGG